MEQALSDRRLEKSTVDIFDGGLDGAIAHYGENTTPRIIIVEADSDQDGLAGKIDALAEVCDPGTQVIVLGAVNDVQMYRALVQQGINDYLVPPFNPVQIFDAIGTICADPSDPPMARVISFMGAKGGAGSSTVAHNTAWALAKMYNDDVAVIDLDLAFGTVGLAFNLEAQQGVQEALAHPERLDEVLLERFMAKQDDHLFLLTSPGNLDSTNEIDPESLDVLLNLVRRTVSYVVLDVPYLWTVWSRHALTVSDEIVLTSNLDLASLRDTKALFETLTSKRANDAPMRFVLNHLGAYRKSQLSAKDFEGAVGSDPTIVIPHDPALFGTAANNGQMIGGANKRNKTAELFESLARTVSGRNPAKKKHEFSLFKRKPKETKANDKAA